MHTCTRYKYNVRRVSKQEVDVGGSDETKSDGHFDVLSPSPVARR